MTIAEAATGAEATVTAVITDDYHSPVKLEGGQAVSVNGQALLEGGEDGQYTRSVPAAEQYTVSVNEPTRGVETTTIASPADFDITSPVEGGTASLSGFTLNWSNANTDLQVEITLTQTLFGDQRSQLLGPFTDTGGMVFDANDLAEFQQGANLVIMVTKINQQNSINGFSTGQLSVSLSNTLLVAPGA